MRARWCLLFPRLRPHSLASPALIFCRMLGKLSEFSRSQRAVNLYKGPVQKLARICLHLKRYGAKIRAPHALVMTFLFKSGSLREKLKAIAQATYTHSRNLAYFVFTYKGLRALQSRIQGKKIPFHSFLAACIGGWLVFGENNNINSQINMYLLSRILFGLSRLVVEKGYIPEPKQDPFPLFAALVWGIVLWLFEYHRHTLQPSLQSSMTYLYDDSNVWHDISDFLIYNKRPAGK